MDREVEKVMKIRYWWPADFNEKERKTLEERIQHVDSVGKSIERIQQDMKKELEYWHKTFRAFSVIPCAYCKKQMRVYPYGGAYYTIKDNQKVHAACYDEYLEQNNATN